MRPTRAFVDFNAIRHNLGVAAGRSPGSRNVAVIKANAYGHGMVRAAQALASTADALAVAIMDEAITLRDAGITAPLLVLEGTNRPGDLEEAAARDIWLMVHLPWQLEALEQHDGSPVGAWLKIDTGMHRLGFRAEEAKAAIDRLLACEHLAHPPVLCTHLACADELDNPLTGKQAKLFKTVTQAAGLQTSIANSAGLMHWPAARSDWNRPGIMLYGSDPTGAAPGDPDLKPAMTLSSEIISVRDIAPGEGVGYGWRWVAASPARIGAIAIGYGDGYPRHARNGTPVWVRGQRAALAGTVSMDMITVDLTGRDDVSVGDPVELWGPNIPINEVAACAGTIAYELLAGMPARLPRVYMG